MISQVIVRTTKNSKDWRFRLEMFNERRRKPGLYLRQVWKRGMKMCGLQWERLLLQVIMHLWWLPLLQEHTLSPRNTNLLIFGSEGVVFCLLEEQSTFPQGNKWLLLTMGLTVPKDWMGYPSLRSTGVGCCWESLGGEHHGHQARKH